MPQPHPSPASPLRCAVIGVGYLGRFHAEKYAALPGAQLVAVVDADPARAHAVADPLGCEALHDHRALLGQVDAVSIATPTPAHFVIAREFLDAGAHVLVEKPLTRTLEEAKVLVSLAEARQLRLATGHLERFNPALRAAEPWLGTPRFIESNRLAPFKPRGLDVSVVLDLMIHDIDIVLELVPDPLVRVEAVGASVLSAEIDIANARLHFANGSVANVTASRVSERAERKLRLFQSSGYISVDFMERRLRRVTHRTEVEAKDDDMGERFEREELTLPPGDALRDEIADFLDAIRNGRPPLVDGRAGLRALETALRVSRAIESGEAT